ncbi:hypothetical protein QYE76_003431 [Lolium multiflorum]|uniref:CCHC-type domain-containing protein n=1 Tax=Lolium multiflorum TaxID=4521 RepID=A0AAD8W1K5_LOLMU|nr:hypothetical protein QYE76_003431 [Lolium multiflorum]
MMQLLQTLMADRKNDRAKRQANIAALQKLANNNHGHGNHDHPGSKLKNFQNTNPPVFSKTEEPLDADDWLQTMENNLEVAGVDANEKVLFATHYLAGPARAWWTSTRAMNGGQVMTWADFKLKFNKYHVPPSLIKKMRDEFRELKQGRMTVVEYRDKFLTLSRYAPMIPTPPRRGERFERTADADCPRQHPFADLGSLKWAQQYPKVSPQLKRRFHSEKQQQAPDADITPGLSEPEWSNYNNNNNNFNGAPPRALNTNNNNTNTASTGSNAIPVAVKDKATITCYECGVVGHYSNECPKRLAKIAANPAAPAQQQRRVSTGKKFTPNNPNNRSGRLFHMNAEEAQEAPDVVLAEENVHKIREYLKTAQSRQKSYANKRHREMTFEIGDFVYLKVSPLKGMQRFQLKGKLAPRYVGPFKVLSRRGEVSYQLELPEEMAAVHDVFHISLLRKCLEVDPREDRSVQEYRSQIGGYQHGLDVPRSAHSHPGRSILNHPHQEYQVPEDSMEQPYKTKPLGSGSKI